MPITAEYDGGFLVLQSPKHMKEFIKELPVRQWNDKTFRWMLPGNAESLADLRRMCARNDLELVLHPSCAALDEQARMVLAAQDAKVADNLAQPEVTTMPLRQHQTRGYHFAKQLIDAKRRGIMLALDMGTGKTCLAITAIQNIVGPKARVLVVCPNKVGQNWGMQLKKFCAHPYDALVMTKKALKMDNVPSKYHSTGGRAQLLCDIWNRTLITQRMLWVVVNYEAAWQGALGATIHNCEWDAVVCDESHCIKSAGSQVSKWAAKFGQSKALRFALSGTALSENLMDAYGQYRFLDPAVFGTSFVRFRSRYAKMGGYQCREITGYQNVEEFHRKFFSIAYRVEKDEVLDLPERTFEQVECVMSDEQRAAYMEMYKLAKLEVASGEITAKNAMSKTQKLRQICSGFVYDEAGDVHQVGDDKFGTLAEMVEGIDINEPLVIFCEFKEEIAAVRRALESSGRRIMEISGEADDYMEWTQARGGEVVVCQTRAGGVGIELQRARYCFFVSPTWSLTTWKQAIDRIHRDGQERPCFYYLFSTKGTVEPKIYRALQDKGDVIKAFMAGELEDSLDSE